MSKRRSLMSSKVHVKPSGEIVDSWEQIVANINAGKHKELYAPGNWKTHDMGNDGIMCFVLLGFDKHTGIKTDWMSNNLTRTTTAYSGAPFLSCKAGYDWTTQPSNGTANVLQNTIKPKLPKAVRDNLKKITVYFSTRRTNNPSDSYPSYGSCTGSGVTDLWIPSREDLTGIYSQMLGTAEKRIMCRAGETSPSPWPTRDCEQSSGVGLGNYYTWDYHIDTSGNVVRGGYSWQPSCDTYHFPIGFCL